MTIAKSGLDTLAGVRVASTWGTPVACGATHRLPAEISDSANESELVARQLGSGNAMATSATKANIQPTVSLTMDLGFRNNADTILAQFFGTAAAPTQQTAGQGDYLHSLQFNTTLNSKYLTIARESSTSTVIEYPSCATRSVTIRTTQIPGYMELAAELVANTIALSSVTNTNATLATTNITDPTIATASFSDDFWIDTQASAALASADQLNITSYELSLTRPQILPTEIKGSAGNGAPIADGLFEGTLTVTLAQNANHTWLTAWNAETVYKSRLQVESTQIGTGLNRQYNIYLPGMVLIQKPEINLANDGANPVTLTFKLTKPSANPTGMSSTYPYIEVVNTLSTSLLA
jgi:hypothetical protein